MLINGFYGSVMQNLVLLSAKYRFFGFEVFQFSIHACLRALVIRERACACTSRCVYVCCINNKFVLLHLALMMDLCAFSISFVHLSYVSERVLA